MMGFKAGDRVRVFGHKANDWIPVDGVVVAGSNSNTNGNKASGCTLPVFHETKGTFYAHPKQCRRLVKRERRSVWIGVGALEEHDAMPGRGFANGWEIHFVKPMRIGYVEFVQVVRKK